ncbi:MAG: quinolinate synthase NadA [Planctomycetota bacterium]
MSDSELLNKLDELKKKRNAVILAHNYQRGEVQDAADMCGDSLELARKAAKTDANVIVFCGVHFMAETAAITCPGKTVIMPDVNAGCPMANMITPRELRKVLEKHPGAYVITYVNSTAAIKAMSDICCTSSNAVKILELAPPDREVIFIPDQSLGDYAARELGREVVHYRGYCPTHHRMLPEDIHRARKEHPAAKITVHPECIREVRELADHIGSTSQIVRFCAETDAEEIVVGTEIGLLHRIRKENPGKIFYPLSELADCPNMKLTTLEKMVWALEDMENVVAVPPDIAEKARFAIERMMEVVC